MLPVSPTQLSGMATCILSSPMGGVTRRFSDSLPFTLPSGSFDGRASACGWAVYAPPGRFPSFPTGWVLSHSHRRRRPLEGTCLSTQRNHCITWGTSWPLPVAFLPRPTRPRHPRPPYGCGSNPRAPIGASPSNSLAANELTDPRQTSAAQAPCRSRRLLHDPAAYSRSVPLSYEQGRGRGMRTPFRPVYAALADGIRPRMIQRALPRTSLTVYTAQRGHYQ